MWACIGLLIFWYFLYLSENHFNIFYFTTCFFIFMSVFQIHVVFKLIYSWTVQSQIATTKPWLRTGLYTVVVQILRCPLVLKPWITYVRPMDGSTFIYCNKVFCWVSNNYLITCFSYHHCHKRRNFWAPGTKISLSMRRLASSAKFTCFAYKLGALFHISAIWRADRYPQKWFLCLVQWIILSFTTLCKRIHQKEEYTKTIHWEEICFTRVLYYCVDHFLFPSLRD